MNDEIEIYDRTTPTPFNGWNQIRRAKKIFSNGGKIKRAGKELNLQEFINENNIDCTIYDVMDKYRGDKKMTQAQLNTLTHTVADELTEIKDLKSALDMMNKAKKVWNELPNDIKKEFGNNVGVFQKQGLNWANKKIAEFKKQQETLAEQIKQQQTEVQPTLTEKATNNG